MYVLIMFCVVFCLSALFFCKSLWNRVRISEGEANSIERIQDYEGSPIAMRFEYVSEDGLEWSSIRAEVVEIYHYGSCYFLRCIERGTQNDRTFRCNRIRHIEQVTECSASKVGRLFHSLHVADWAASAASRAAIPIRTPMPSLPQ